MNILPEWVSSSSTELLVVFWSWVGFILPNPINIQLYTKRILLQSLVGFYPNPSSNILPEFYSILVLSYVKE